MESNNPVGTQPTSKKTSWILIILIILLASTTGIFAYKYYQAKQQLDQLIPEPTASQAPNGDLTDWKTYTNNDARFSFKYPVNPTNYVFKQTDNLVAISAIPEPTLFRVLTIPTNNSPQEWWNGLEKESWTQIPTKDFDVKTTTFKEKPALLIKLKPNTNNRPVYGSFFVFKANNNIMQLFFTTDQPEGNQILSTFQFTDQPTE